MSQLNRFCCCRKPVNCQVCADESYAGVIPDTIDVEFSGVSWCSTGTCHPVLRGAFDRWRKYSFSESINTTFTLDRDEGGYWYGGQCGYFKSNIGTLTVTSFDDENCVANRVWEQPVDYQVDVYAEFYNHGSGIRLGVAIVGGDAIFAGSITPASCEGTFLVPNQLSSTCIEEAPEVWFDVNGYSSFGHNGTAEVTL